MAEVLNYQGPSPELPQRRPSVELLLLALPTVAQMASYTVMQFIDRWMLSRVGVEEPAAAGNAGILAFAFISLGMGVLFLVNTLVSQEFGRRDYAKCGRYLWQGAWFSLLYSLLLAPVLPWAGYVFSGFGHAPSLAEKETAYFQIVLAATLVKMLSTTMGQFLLAVNRPSQVLFSTVCGVSVNAVAAWVIVLGHLGVRPMGIHGAAWAQNIGVTVEMLVLLCFVTRPDVRRIYHAGDWPLRAKELKTLLKLGLPSGAQVVADVLAWGLFSALVMGRFGTDAMAANSFIFSYMSVSFMPAFGIATAVTALVGRYIGMGRLDLAIRRAHLGFAMTALYMVACGLFFCLARTQLIEVFRSDPDIVDIGSKLMIFAGVYQLFDALYISYNGALRGAGDTLFPAIATAGLCWSMTVGGGYLIARNFPQWGVFGPWTIATIYGATLGVVMFLRFHRGAWKKIHLDNGVSLSNVTAPSATVPAQ